MSPLGRLRGACRAIRHASHALDAAEDLAVFAALHELAARRALDAGATDYAAALRARAAELRHHAPPAEDGRE